MKNLLHNHNHQDGWGKRGGGGGGGGTAPPPRRKYPKVAPKYYNPLQPTETWSGRGKQPRWLVAALQSGHTLEEFRIRENGDTSDRNAGGQEHS